MDREPDSRPSRSRESLLQSATRVIVLGSTLLFVVLALAISVVLVVYTAWRQDLSRGVFALLFAVLNAQIAVNWLLWKEDGEPPGDDPWDPR